MEEQKTEAQAESVCAEKQESRWRKVLREHFSAPRLAYMALFTALAYAVSFLEFPIFPGTIASFLKLDFANVFFMIEGFIFGPVEAIVSVAIKEALSLLDSQTMGVGEIANFIMSFAYIIVPSVCYRFIKGRKWVLLFLAISCFVQIGISLIVNRYINYPFYCEFLQIMPMSSRELFDATWYFLLAFNVIKSVSISVAVFFIYKPLSRFIKATGERFDRRMARAKGKRVQPVEEESASEGEKGEEEQNRAL